MGKKVPKAASQKTPGSLYLWFLLSLAIAVISSSVRLKSKIDKFSINLSLLVVLGITAVPLWTAHLRTT